MDPNQTYLDMFHAMRDGNFETARELALSLQRWFETGGFYPDQYTPWAMQAYIDSVLRRTLGYGSEPVFSLICMTCDAGDDLETEEAAMAAGWCEIEPAFDLPQANYCGLCPTCRKDEEG